jgi:hypothetical protein
MNHEHGNGEHPPTAEYLFHQVGEIAVLTGYINEIDNKYEQLRQFVIDDFSAPVKERWPQLRRITYTPSYVIDGSAADDMVWITLSDDTVQQDFIISRNDVDECDIEVEYSIIGGGNGRDISDDTIASTQSAIDYIFTGIVLSNQNEVGRVEQNDSQDHSATPSDLALLGQLVHSLSMHPKNK